MLGTVQRTQPSRHRKRTAPAFTTVQRSSSYGRKSPPSKTTFGRKRSMPTALEPRRRFTSARLSREVRRKGPQSWKAQASRGPATSPANCSRRSLGRTPAAPASLLSAGSAFAGSKRTRCRDGLPRAVESQADSSALYLQQAISTTTEPIFRAVQALRPTGSSGTTSSDTPGADKIRSLSVSRVLMMAIFGTFRCVWISPDSESTTAKDRS
mmetsp:Transcript_28692/g.77790  ORF Transcript_28692/g.77790 Transcript_28692/m.77790 type:complete len:211 (+) Transcript_28692:436-1068(+)